MGGVYLGGLTASRFGRRNQSQRFRRLAANDGVKFLKADHSVARVERADWGQTISLKTEVERITHRHFRHNWSYLQRYQ